jgi:hypothetical protein
LRRQKLTEFLEKPTENTMLKHFVLLGILLLGSGNALASESYCYSIKNSDSKNYCLANAKNQKSYCYSIQESDTKNFCLAKVGHQKSYCYSIRANDPKNQCLALFK